MFLGQESVQQHLFCDGFRCIFTKRICVAKVSSSAVQKKQWFWYLLWWTFSNVGYVRVYIKRALFWATWAMRSARLSRWGAYHTRPRSVQVHRFKHMWLEQVSGNDVHCDELAGTAGNVVRDFVMCDEEAEDLWELDGTLPLHSSSWQSLLGTPLLSLSSVSQDLFFNKKTRRKILRRFSEDSQKIVSRLRLLLPLTRRIGRFVFWYVFFFTRFVCVSIGDWFSVCWVGGERDEGSGGRGGGGGERSGFGGLSQVHCPVLSSILSFQSVLEHFCKFLKPYH